jgi:hypothetical protein
MRCDWGTARRLSLDERPQGLSCAYCGLGVQVMTLFSILQGITQVKETIRGNRSDDCGAIRILVMEATNGAPRNRWGYLLSERFDCLFEAARSYRDRQQFNLRFTQNVAVQKKIHQPWVTRIR